MKLTETIPFDYRLENMINGLFGFHESTGFRKHNILDYGINIEEHQDHYAVQVVAPGFKKEEFSIILEKDLLVIEGKKTRSDKENDVKIIRADYVPAAFKKSIHVDNKKVCDPSEAKYENGILQIILPKIRQTLPEKKQIVIS